MDGKGPKRDDTCSHKVAVIMLLSSLRESNEVMIEKPGLVAKGLLVLVLYIARNTLVYERL